MADAELVATAHEYRAVQWLREDVSALLSRGDMHDFKLVLLNKLADEVRTHVDMLCAAEVGNIACPSDRPSVVLVGRGRPLWRKTQLRTETTEPFHIPGDS